MVVLLILKLICPGGSGVQENWSVSCRKFCCANMSLVFPGGDCMLRQVVAVG